jgi:SET domain-containing protein
MLQIIEILGKGRGVISTEAISQDSEIARYELLILNEMTEQLRLYSYPYPFDLNGFFEDDSGRFCLALGEATLLNTSADPNVQWEITPEFLIIRAKKAIKAGKELTISYGFSKEEIDQKGWIT